MYAQCKQLSDTSSSDGSKKGHFLLLLMPQCSQEISPDQDFIQTAPECKLYNTHSFCISAVTLANQADIPHLYIKTLGRWRSDIYLRISPASLASMTKVLISKHTTSECTFLCYIAYVFTYYISQAWVQRHPSVVLLWPSI